VFAFSKTEVLYTMVLTKTELLSSIEITGLDFFRFFQYCSSLPRHGNTSFLEYLGTGKSSLPNEALVCRFTYFGPYLVHIEISKRSYNSERRE
jgi:hypothetical protein